MHFNGIGTQFANLAPVRRITFFIHQTNLGICRIIEMHMVGMVMALTGIGNNLTIHIQRIGTCSVVGMQGEGMFIIHTR